jgi:hypothetical protein
MTMMVMMSLTDFESDYKAFHIVVCGSHLIDYCLAIRCLKREYPKLLGTPRKYLVLATNCGVLGKLV